MEEKQASQNILDEKARIAKDKKLKAKQNALLYYYYINHH